MKITLKDLLDKKIFDSYTIVNGQQDLQKEVESVSILETPDFEHYIIEKSLILTTFYPIKEELELAKKLLHTLADKHTAGLIVKIHRYIDEIPAEIIDVANQLHVPIVTLDYDANLSLLFNNILSEIQARDYTNYSFDENYSEVLQKVYDNPTTKTLMRTVEHIEDLDLLIENLENNTIHYSSSTIFDYYQSFKNTKNLIQRVDEMLYYSEDVVYDGKPIYRMVFLAKNDRRHIIHNYVEIFKLMVVVIYQKKLENSFKQNQFLLNFVSNLSSNYTNSQIIEASKRYKWKIAFPITLILINMKEQEKNVISPSVIDYTRTVVVNKFHVSQQELRYAYLNEQMLFIVNITEHHDLDTTMRQIHQKLEEKYKQMDIKITYSNRIHKAKDISRKYAMLSDAFIHIENKKLDISLYKEENIALLNLFRKVDYIEIKAYVDQVLGTILEYEKENKIPLIETLLVYIESKFNAKETAGRLFIHYNTVRYRLSILKELNIDIVEHNTSYFELYIALYLHKNFNI